MNKNNGLAEQIKGWEQKDAELDKEIELFERQYKHLKPCKRYKETGYCPHLVNAQYRKFGKRADTLIGNLVAMSER